MSVEVFREQLRWVISNKKTIIDYLVDNGIIEFAERWMQKKGENEAPLQITKDDIRNSLCFDSISVHFDKDMDNPRMDICIVFDPDYCDGCFTMLLVEENKSFTYGGIGRNRRRQREAKV